MEIDDHGFPPENYRDLIILHGGLWDLAVTAGKKVDVALAAKQALGLDSKAAIQFAQGVPGTVWQGTRTEVEWLCGHLQRRGVECEWRRKSGD